MNFRILCAGILMLAINNPIQAARLTLLPQWLDSPQVRHLFMLPDGRTITGVDGTDVFRWAVGEDRTVIGTIPKSYGESNVAVYVTDVSADGSKFIGRIGDNFFDPSVGFTWTTDNGFELMPGSWDATILSPIPVAMSGDGEVIVGMAREYPDGVLGDSHPVVFRWTRQDGTTSLGFAGIPSAISADGNTIVGSWPISDISEEAFRWTETTGAIGLGFLPSTWPSSLAFEVSSDGQLIVGGSFGEPPINGLRAFIWTEQLGMKLLTNRGNYHGVAAISASGNVIIGTMTTLLEDGNFAGDSFIWRRNYGLQTLSEIMDELELDQLHPIADPTKTQYLYAVSGDGNVVFGASVEAIFVAGSFIPRRRYEYWLLDITTVPEPSTCGFLLMAAMTTTLICSGRPPRQKYRGVTVDRYG